MKQNVLPAGTLKSKNVTSTFYEEKKAVEDKLQSNEGSVITEDEGKLMIISASYLRALHIVQIKHEKFVRESACVLYVCPPFSSYVSEKSLITLQRVSRMRKIKLLGKTVIGSHCNSSVPATVVKNFTRTCGISAEITGVSRNVSSGN